MYEKLVTKVNDIDISGFVLKTKCETDKLELKKKISDADKKIAGTSGLVKKTDLNARITEIEGKTPSITGLATNSALTAVENEIPDVNSLVKKIGYDAKILEIEKKTTDHDHDKYIIISEFMKLTAENFKAILAQENLVTKADFDTRLIRLNKKLTQIKQNL